MTDITKEDEREAREWLEHHIALSNDALPGSILAHQNKCERTILSLLDAPRLPRPEDVPDDVCIDMMKAAGRRGSLEASGRAALQVHYDHYAKPPAPKRDEMWRVKEPTGAVVGTFDTKEEAEAACKDRDGWPTTRRIIHLVEADHE